MAVSIIQPSQREAGFDKFLRRVGGVVGVANQGINTYAQLKDLSAKARQAQDDAEGVYSAKELDPLKWSEAAQGDEGAQMFRMRTPEGVTEVYKRRYEQIKPKSKLDEELDRAEVELKKAQAFSLKNKPQDPELEWNKIPKPDQDIVRELSKKNASKISIKNQIDAVMSGWDNLSDDEKVAQGRQLIKTLNSTEGADAVGVEEARRLGGKLEFAMGNLFNSNPIQFGRDLEGFKNQAIQTSDAIGKAIESNQNQVLKIAGPKAAGKGLGDLVKKKEKAPENIAVNELEKLSDAEIEKLYYEKKAQERQMRAR